ncbi:UDP pyrophosphate phosphatase, putative [Babesia ovata]|uniref:UDP pyrophosphate phosphatase, putative n=1 Tax=Babesia ovata TaxID=189622 RepID=A0A2H6KJU0_9APIC|nr:UDP pyrophosphate phosphatase, putative [Babesia ovata]GBE63265.1 UDP pyrophosphate phosphatase, putative [Babesia ovata]
MLQTGDMFFKLFIRLLNCSIIIFNVTEFLANVTICTAAVFLGIEILIYIRRLVNRPGKHFTGLLIPVGQLAVNITQLLMKIFNCLISFHNLLNIPAELLVHLQLVVGLRGLLSGTVADLLRGGDPITKAVDL